MTPPCACGSEWWEERRVIRPAAQPSADPRLRTTAREVVYQLACADCGASSDPTNQKTNQTAPRRRRKAVA